MIIELYTFSPGSFVVAEEWNANFKALYNVSIQHEESIQTDRETIAFPNSDLTQVYNAVRSAVNSWPIDGNSIIVGVEQEFYQVLYQNLSITIPQGMNGECRVLIYLPQDWNQKFYNINYSGTVIEYMDGYYNGLTLPSGYYYIMIHESNNVAQVKLIWTGV